MTTPTDEQLTELRKKLQRLELQKAREEPGYQPKGALNCHLAAVNLFNDYAQS